MCKIRAQFSLDQEMSVLPLTPIPMFFFCFCFVLNKIGIHGIAVMSPLDSHTLDTIIRSNCSAVQYLQT